jgi:two-component system, cell cycle sensor histidine kinase and response regulator CckA
MAQSLMTNFFRICDAGQSPRPGTPAGGPAENEFGRLPADAPSQSLVRKFTREYLLLSLIPVISFFACTVLGALFSERYIADLMHRSNHQLSAYAKKQLEDAGQIIIRNRVQDVATQVELFIAFNPHLEMRQLQDNEKFKALAVQTVGLTGYTCLYEAGTGIMRLHPNPELIDRDMRFLAEKLPAWWAIFEASLAGVAVSGYYDWIEPGGRVRDKYMAMAPVAVNFHGQTLMIAATTYIDEFSQPALTMNKRSEEASSDYQRFIAQQVVIIGSIMATILCLTLIAVFRLSQHAARRFIYPIVTLAGAAEGFGEGQLDCEENSAISDRKDEIGALARAFQRMRLQIRRQFQKLESNYSTLKSTQEALKKSEAHYRSLFNNLSIGLYRTTPEGLVLDANPTLVKMFGFPDKESLLARRADELYVTAEDREVFKRTVGSQPCGSQFECRMRRYDGTAIWVENQSTVFRDAAGRPLYYEGSIKDITERKLAEEALRNSEARFRTAFENASVGITLVNLDGVYTEVNPALARMIGYSPAELIGRPVADFTHPDDLSLRGRFLSNLLDGRIASGEQERRFVHKDGSTVWTLIWASLHRDQKGRPLYFISLVQDLTARKRADEEKGKLESQLLQAQKMEAIGSLAGGIAHDFNNILSAIIGYTELSMLSDGAPVDYLQEALKAANRAKDLVKQILSFSRQTDEERMPIHVGMVVKEVVKFLRASIPATIDIRCDIDPNAGSVLANSVELHQILMNLCTNAVHAIGGQAGVVAIRVQPVEITAGKRDAFPDLEAGCYVELAVKDTGAGIRPELLERIFDPYFTTKEKGVGTGLGLAVVHGIVRKTKGSIRVESRPGSGSLFYIYLPQIKLSAAAPPNPSVLPRGGSERILFVDDEKMIADVGERILKRLGYAVVSRTSPIEALELFKAKPGGFDLVISDQTMPGMTGDALARELMKIQPDIPVILCTGYSQLIDAEKAREKGIGALVMKPILITELDEAIRRVLKKGPRPDHMA